MEPPSVLHVLKVWGCTAYALVHVGREKFDSKVTRLVHLGYDVARSAYVLCALPHFNLSYSAHVTFNEEEFPMRDVYRADPNPSSLFEATAGFLGQERVGGDWGRVIETRGGSAEMQPAPTGEPGVLGRPTMVGRPVVSSWTASSGIPNVLSVPTPADEPGGSRNTTFQGSQDALSQTTRRIGVDDALPTLLGSGRRGRLVPRVTPDEEHQLSSVGGGAQAHGGAVRRSTRGWKPSAGCLEGIAHVTRELAHLEEVLASTEIGEDRDGCGVSRESSRETTLEHTHWLRECSFAAQGVDLCPRVMARPCYYLTHRKCGRRKSASSTHI